MTVERVRASKVRRAHRAALATGAAVAFYTAAAFGAALYVGLSAPIACLLAAATGSVLAAAASVMVRREEERARQRRVAAARLETQKKAQAKKKPRESGFARPEESRESRESREIQTALLPSWVPALEGYHLEVCYEPCGALGGDFYDFIECGDGRMLLTLGDVSGKGPSGAIVMAMVQTLFRQCAPRSSGPADLLRRVNEGFSGTLGKGIFVTAMAALLDPVRHTLTLAGAGHPPLILLNPRERRATRVSAQGPALGLVGDTVFADSAAETTIDLAAGDSLLLYTDGATDCVDHLSTGMGESRLLAAAAASVLPGPRDALDRLKEDLWEQGGRRDDTTLLLIAREGPEPNDLRSADRAGDMSTKVNIP